VWQLFPRLKPFALRVGEAGAFRRVEDTYRGIDRRQTWRFTPPVLLLFSLPFGWGWRPRVALDACEVVTLWRSVGEGDTWWLSRIGFQSPML
jgi:hypothetical protein